MRLTPEQAELDAREWRDRLAGSLNALSKDVHATAQEKGFWSGDFQDNAFTIPLKMSLIASEAFEAVDAHRKSQSLETVAGELGDILVRVLDLMGYLDLDVEKTLTDKAAFFKTRPFLHGKRF